MKTITVNTEKKNIELVISLPFVNKTIGGAPKTAPAKKVIDAYKMILLEAIEARMEACYSNLQSHLGDVVYTDEFRIEYLRKNGTSHSFNIPNYRNMEACRKVLLTLDAERILEELEANPAWAEQLCKALYWVKPEDRNGQCFGDLISLLMECAMYGPRGTRYEA